MQPNFSDQHTVSHIRTILAYFESTILKGFWVLLCQVFVVLSCSALLILIKMCTSFTGQSHCRGFDSATIRFLLIGCQAFIWLSCSEQPRILGRQTSLGVTSEMELHWRRKPGPCALLLSAFLFWTGTLPLTRVLYWILCFIVSVMLLAKLDHIICCDSISPSTSCLCVSDLWPPSLPLPAPSPPVFSLPSLSLPSSPEAETFLFDRPFSFSSFVIGRRTR
jgi:hypothetical protein